jgi:hypothetical protein
MRFSAGVVISAVAATCLLSACDDDLFGDDTISLMTYTCTKPALRDARQLSAALRDMGMRAALIPACDSAWAYVRFRPAVSVEDTAAKLTKAFNCEELVDPGPRTINLRCRIDRSRFVAELYWDERTSASGKPILPRYGQAVFVRSEADEGVVLGPR